jgi:hypothetical protein
MYLDTIELIFGATISRLGRNDARLIFSSGFQRAGTQPSVDDVAFAQKVQKSVVVGERYSRVAFCSSVSRLK